MSIPRMMTRRLMILVASIALVLGCTTEFLRQKRAAEHLGLAMRELGYTQQALAVSDELEQEAMVTPDPHRASARRKSATGGLENGLAAWLQPATRLLTTSGGNMMASIKDGCTRDGGLALVYTAVVPVMGNWLAHTYC